jgi:hypothetical protein
MKVDGTGVTCSRREERANGQDLFLGTDLLGVIVVVGKHARRMLTRFN